MFYSPENQKANREVRKLKPANELEGVTIIKKLDDIPELKETLISIYETKSHKDVSRYSLLLAEHVLSLTGMPRNETVESCFSVSRAWQESTAKFQEARQVAFALHRLAREETNPAYVLTYRTLGQIAATPHVKRHALVGSDYAVKLINRMYPNDTDKAREMREKQIALMQNV
ncbi:MAG: putative immunity protein [Clostridiaceae bacterium]